MIYLYLDARYEKVRQAGIVQDAAILMASGVQKDGKRSILGISVSLSEAEVHWRAFLEGLVARGLHGVILIISDDHVGLQAARKTVFSGVPWQRCQFHLQQNAQLMCPDWVCVVKWLKISVPSSMRRIGKPAEAYLGKAVKKYAHMAPKLADWGGQSSGWFYGVCLPKGPIRES